MEDGTCVNYCMPGTFGENKLCKPCDPGCENCFGPESNNCTSCPPGEFLHPGTQTCSASCPEAYYEDLENKICQPCLPTCVSCLGPDVCVTCKSDYYFVKGNCLDSCPDGTHISKTSF